MQGYRLDFFKPESERSIWNGAAANVIEDENESVWGAVWELDLMDMASLDAQEGVHIDIYVPVMKEVHNTGWWIIRMSILSNVKCTQQ